MRILRKIIAEPFLWIGGLLALVALLFKGAATWASLAANHIRGDRDNIVSSHPQRAGIMDWMLPIITWSALIGYAAFSATFAHVAATKNENSYWLTQWETDNINNPEVQQRIEIIKSRQSR